MTHDSGVRSAAGMSSYALDCCVAGTAVGGIVASIPTVEVFSRFPMNLVVHPALPWPPRASISSLPSTCTCRT